MSNLNINNICATFNLNQPESDYYFFEAEHLPFLQVPSRFPLQSCMPNSGTQGFPLQSGLKINILLLYNYPKKKSGFAQKNTNPLFNGY